MATTVYETETFPAARLPRRAGSQASQGADLLRFDGE